MDVETFTQSNKGVILLKCAIKLKSLETCIFVNFICFLRNQSEVAVACFLLGCGWLHITIVFK